MTFAFTISVHGTPKNIRLLNAYPSRGDLGRLGFIEFARAEISEWRFAPATRNGKPVPARVIQPLVYLLDRRSFHYADNMKPNPHKTKALHQTLEWLCSGTMFPAQPIKIVPAPPGTAPAPLPRHPPGSSARSGDAPFSFLIPSKESPFIAQRILMLDPALTREVKKLKTTSVTLRYCVDPRGRLANAIVASGNSRATKAGLGILENLRFRARKIAGDPVWSCGLHTRIEFYGEPKNGVLGLVHRSSFETLASRPKMRKVVSATAPKVKISIPANAQLPARAVVEVRFCISAAGKPYHLDVTEATPPKLFNRAAKLTVKAKRFAPGDHAVCDVYRKIGFKIPRSRHRRAASSR